MKYLIHLIIYTTTVMSTIAQEPQHKIDNSSLSILARGCDPA